jgi:hypothetical protein
MQWSDDPSGTWICNYNSTKSALQKEGTRWSQQGIAPWELRHSQYPTEIFMALEKQKLNLRKMHNHNCKHHWSSKLWGNRKCYVKQLFYILGITYAVMYVYMCMSVRLFSSHYFWKNHYHAVQSTLWILLDVWQDSLDWGSAHRKALPTQDNKTHKKRGRTDTETHTHYNLVSTGIRTHDPSVRAAPRPYQFHKVNANMRRMIDRSLFQRCNVSSTLDISFLNAYRHRLSCCYFTIKMASIWGVAIRS